MACFFKVRPLLAVLVLAWATCSLGQTPEPEKLIPVRSTQMMDKRGNRWDFNQMGGIYYGTNDCFNNAAMLQIEGSPVNFPRAMMTPDGKEFVYTTPYRTGMVVTRRVRLDQETGALRYLDVIQAQGNAALRGTITITTNLGNNALQVLDLKDKPFAGPLGKEDGAFVAMGQDSRPSAIFIVSDPKSKAKPQVRVNGNRTFEVSYSYDLPKGGSVAFLHYLAQRAGGTAADARELLGTYFKRGRVIDPGVPKEWVKLLANFPNGASAESDEKSSPLLAVLQELGESNDIARGKLDTVQLDAGSKISGTVSSADFEIETVFGKSPVVFADVAGIEGGASVMRPIRVFMRDGEILVGEVKDAKISMKTESGLSLEVDLSQLNLLVMRTALQDGVAAPNARILVTTQRGDRLALSEEGGPVEVATPWGMGRVPLAQLRSLVSIREPFPAHRVALADRSRFVAMLRGAEWSAPTLRFGVIKMAPQGLRELQRIGETVSEDDEEKPKVAVPYSELIGESRLAGTIDLPALHLVAESSVTPITPAQIVQMEAEGAENGDRVVTVKLVDGQELKGRLTENILPVRSGDRVWRVPAAHLVAYRVPQAEKTDPKTEAPLPPKAPSSTSPPGLLPTLPPPPP